MVLRVDNIAKKLIEDIKNSVSGDILEKIETQKSILDNIRDNVSNLSFEEDVNKLDKKLKEIIDNLEESFEETDKNIKNILDKVVNEISKTDLEENKNYLENCISISKNDISNELSNIKTDIESIKENINSNEQHSENIKIELTSNIEEKINKLETNLDDINVYVKKSNEEYSIKIKEFEETLEYLSLPFYKRLFGRKKWVLF